MSATENPRKDKTSKLKLKKKKNTEGTSNFPDEDILETEEREGR